MASDSQYPVSEHVGSNVAAETDSGPEMMQPEEQEACRLHLSRLSPLLNQLLDTCIAKHSPTCVEFPKGSIEARFLLRRLIDIGPVERFCTPCLQDTEEESIGDRRCVALSHVWGNPDEATWQDITTTMATLVLKEEGFQHVYTTESISGYGGYLSASWYSMSLDWLFVYCSGNSCKAGSWGLDLLVFIGLWSRLEELVIHYGSDLRRRKNKVSGHIATKRKTCQQSPQSQDITY